jgi:hypothetical protein
MPLAAFVTDVVLDVAIDHHSVATVTAAIGSPGHVLLRTNLFGSALLDQQKQNMQL